MSVGCACSLFKHRAVFFFFLGNHKEFGCRAGEFFCIFIAFFIVVVVAVVVESSFILMGTLCRKGSADSQRAASRLSENRKCGSEQKSCQRCLPPCVWCESDRWDALLEFHEFGWRTCRRLG